MITLKAENEKRSEQKIMVTNEYDGEFMMNMRSTRNTMSISKVVKSIVREIIL